MNAIQKAQQTALIIYHANCLDGFTAAWIAEGTLSQVMDTTLYPAKYKEEPPYDLIDNNTQVYILDFSYRPKELHEIAAQAHSVTLLDHHKSAIEDLAGFTDPNVSLILDLERSGAGLAWTFFNGTKTMPRLVAYVQDRDLWRFKMADSKAVTEAMYARPFELSAWDDMASMDEEELVHEGEILLSKKSNDIAGWIKYPIWIGIGGHYIPALNVPAAYSSDTAHALHKAFPEAGFAATYQDIELKEGGLTRTFSLRSSNDGLDVSAIARKFGGGGHRNASGFSVPFSRIDATGSPTMEDVEGSTIVFDSPLEEAQHLMEKALQCIADARDAEEGDS